MKKKKITVADLARKSGVSAATVSRVINHRELVKEETVRAVEKAMVQLGYAHKNAEKPVSGQKQLIILNVPDTQNVFYQEVIRGARMSANAHGFFLLIYESYINPGTIQNFCGLIQRVSAAGVILLNQLNETLLNQIQGIVPLIQCCEYNKEAAYPYVGIDDLYAAKNATEHLISCGHHKIAFINGPLSFKYAVDRQQGFLEALETAGITVPKSWIVQLPEVHYELAYSAICRLLNGVDVPNAIFAISDVFAMAALRAAHRYGLKVPRDLMVVGFDNIEFSMMTSPSITTVDLPKYQMGYCACEMLIDYILNPLAEPRSILLDTQLVIRESTFPLNSN